MQGLALAMKDAEPVLARARADRRRFRRVRVDLPGRLFTPSDGQEARCSVVDLRTWFAACNIDPRGLLSCEIAPSLGLDFKGRAHNALDDARSMAASMEEMVKRGAVRPAA